MKKAGVLSILFVVILLAVAVIAYAQQAKKVHRIGYLSALDPATDSARYEAIRLALRERGYIVGQNIAIEYRYAEGKPDRYPELAAELVRLKVDIIVAAGGTRVVQAAKNATKTIPIVMMGAGGADPVEAGVIESLARPGGNVTGVATLSRELSGKRLELLKEAVPKVARVAVLYDAATPGIVLDVKEALPAAARALGVTIQPWEVRDADGFDKVFAAIGKQRTDGLSVASGRLMDANQKRIVGFALNIATEYRYAEGKVDRFPELAAELVRLKVDIIVAAGGTRLILAAKNATKTIPIVMAGGGLDPVAAGLVESLARPGGNVTGLTNLSRELGGKRLELLKEAVPKLARVAVLYDPTSLVNAFDVKEVLPVAARALGLTIQPWEVRTVDDFDRVFAALSKQRPDGLYVASNPLMDANQKRTIGFALKSRLPSVGNKGYVDAGGLMYYGADLADSYRRVAYYVDRILKGARPADLPVEQPTKFELVINLKTAKQIGLTIPPEVLARATKLIK